MRLLGLIFRNSGLNCSPVPMFTGTILYGRPHSSIMLEECGLPYKIVPVNIGTGEQFKPEFLKISPNNRMPAIVDHDPPGGGAPVSVFESGAILQYLAEKTAKFLPKDLRGKYEVLQWVNWQMGGDRKSTRLNSSHLGIS